MSDQVKHRPCVRIPNRPWPLDIFHQLNGLARALVVRYMGESWKWRNDGSFIMTVDAAAEFINDAVNSRPALLAEIAELKAQRDKLLEACKALLRDQLLERVWQTREDIRKAIAAATPNPEPASPPAQADPSPAPAAHTPPAGALSTEEPDA